MNREESRKDALGFNMHDACARMCVSFPGVRARMLSPRDGLIRFARFSLNFERAGQCWHS